MQYCPPCVTPNGGQTYPCNPFPVTQPCCPCPQVIGEGNVASITLPDGSVQLYFVPAPAPTACCPPQNYPNWNNPEAWFIRSIPNQFPAYQPVPNQQYQRISNPSWTQNHADCYGNKPSYQLKFHNDNWTSTTDLHYFSPPLRNWFPKQSTSSQTEQPPSAPVEPPPWPDKLCRCACFKQNQNRKRSDDLSADKSSCSSMSVEFEKKEKPIISSRIKKKKAWPSRKIQISENPSIKCECDLQPDPRKSDKAIATYAEKTVGCCADNGRETQTTCGPSTPVRRVDSFFRVNNYETELWYPKTPLSRNSMECTECAELEVCESGDLTSAAGASDSDATSRN